MQGSKGKLTSSLSMELINGYYLSFLAIGLLFVIVKNDLNGDLTQGLFFILMVLIFGSLSLFKSAVSKDNMQQQSLEESVDLILAKLDWQLTESSNPTEKINLERAIDQIKSIQLERTVGRTLDLIRRNE